MLLLLFVCLRRLNSTLYGKEKKKTSPIAPIMHIHPVSFVFRVKDHSLNRPCHSLFLHYLLTRFRFPLKRKAHLDNTRFLFFIFIFSCYSNTTKSFNNNKKSETKNMNIFSSTKQNNTKKKVQKNFCGKRKEKIHSKSIYRIFQKCLKSFGFHSLFIFFGHCCLLPLSTVG